MPLAWRFEVWFFFPWTNEKEDTTFNRFPWASCVRKRRSCNSFREWESKSPNQIVCKKCAKVAMERFVIFFQLFIHYKIFFSYYVIIIFSIFIHHVTLLIINVKILFNFQKEWCTFGNKKGRLTKTKIVHFWGLSALNM